MGIDQSEVVIVGGGPAGSAAALHLRRMGRSVTVLEKAHLPRPKPCGESLSPGAMPLLADLGVLAELSAGPHGRRAGFTVFPSGEPPFRGTYAFAGRHDPALSTGLSISRLHLDAVLLAAARRAGATVLEGWTMREIGAWDGRVRTVRGIDARGEPFALRAPLVIGADGVHSTVARQLGLARPSRSLRQVAFVAHLHGIRHLDAFGEMHVLAQAYCGIAPLAGGLATVAMVLPRAAVRDRSPRTYPGGVTGFFQAHLQRYPHLRDRVQDAAVVAGPWTTSGLACTVRRRVDDGVLLIGDAGGYYDPFTGEGIYRALRGAVLAARTAEAAFTRNSTARRHLQSYTRAYLREFVPKHLVEVIVHHIITRQPIFRHVASRLRRRPELADVLVGVTGDLLSPYTVLTPWYLARLFM